MADPKPLYATDYTPEQLDRSQRALLQVAVALGDDLPHVVLVGGLAPLYLVDQVEAATRDDAHIGTVDVDVGLQVALLADEDRYDALAARLAGSRFAPDRNENGNPTPQRWAYTPDPAAKVDFLIDETETGDAERRVLHIRDDLGALRVLGLALAFEDAVEVLIEGETLDGAHARRTIRVCGPGAFVVLKAIAFRQRAARKDAYDLAYVLRNVEGGPEAVADRLRPHVEHPAVQRALTLLAEDFGEERATGPVAASLFRYADELDDEYIADVVGSIGLLTQGL